MPYCSNCGNKVNNEMLFCSQCGNRLRTPNTGLTDSTATKMFDSSTEAKAKKPEDTPGQRIKKSKLYKQWVDHAGLPNEEIPAQKTFKDIPVKEEKTGLHPSILYVFFGIIIIILCAALVILIMKY